MSSNDVPSFLPTCQPHQIYEHEFVYQPVGYRTGMKRFVSYARARTETEQALSIDPVATTSREVEPVECSSASSLVFTPPETPASYPSTLATPFVGSSSDDSTPAELMFTNGTRSPRSLLINHPLWLAGDRQHPPGAHASTTVTHVHPGPSTNAARRYHPYAPTPLIYTENQNYQPNFTFSDPHHTMMSEANSTVELLSFLKQNEANECTGGMYNAYATKSTSEDASTSRIVSSSTVTRRGRKRVASPRRTPSSHIAPDDTAQPQNSTTFGAQQDGPYVCLWEGCNRIMEGCDGTATTIKISLINHGHIPESYSVVEVFCRWPKNGQHCNSPLKPHGMARHVAAHLRTLVVKCKLCGRCQARALQMSRHYLACPVFARLDREAQRKEWDISVRRHPFSMFEEHLQKSEVRQGRRRRRLMIPQ
ncbi:hypothetical protein AX17_003630 [Amanita inopinata Kibby_2008]|nr:hypothetical protein AX17_003630 [Amanita inopinata Kibby_2008]